MPPSEQPTLAKITTEDPGAGYFRAELKSLRVIGVEEHVTFPELAKGIPNEGTAKHARRRFGEMVQHEAMQYAAGRVCDAGKQRIADMDASGIALQVLSLAGG